MDNEGKSMRPSGYWKDWDNFEREAKEAIELNDGNRPTHQYLTENGYGGLVSAANNYHDGLTNVLDRVIGEETESRKPMGYYQVWENVERDAKEAIEKIDEKFDLIRSASLSRPTAKWLKENGYGSLAMAANSYHEGLTNVFDRIMGEKPTKIQKQIEKIVTNGLGYSNHLSRKGMNTNQDLQRHLLDMNIRVKYSDRK